MPNFTIYLFEGSADDELVVNPPDDHGTPDTTSNMYAINIIKPEIGVSDE